MATPRSLFCTSQFSTSLRSFATTAKPSHYINHLENHKFLEPNSFLGCWEVPKDPKEAEAKLAQLRRNYAKQVRDVRKEYIREMELMRLEKQMKDDARREAIRVANEERKKLKAEAAKLKAEERKIAQEEFRQTLVCLPLLPSYFCDTFGFFSLLSSSILFGLRSAGREGKIKDKRIFNSK